MNREKAAAEITPDGGKGRAENLKAFLEAYRATGSQKASAFSNPNLLARLKLILNESGGADIDNKLAAKQIGRYLSNRRDEPLPEFHTDWTKTVEAWQDAIETGIAPTNLEPFDISEKDEDDFQRAMYKCENGWWNCDSSDLNEEFEDFMVEIVESDITILAHQLNIRP